MSTKYISATFLLVHSHQMNFNMQGLHCPHVAGHHPDVMVFDPPQLALPYQLDPDHQADQWFWFHVHSTATVIIVAVHLPACGFGSVVHSTATVLTHGGPPTALLNASL